MGAVHGRTRGRRYLLRQPPAPGLRRGAGPVRGRQRLRRLRPRLSLLDVAAKPPDAAVLAARLASCSSRRRVLVANMLRRLASLFVVNIVAQRFIEKRSPLRWAAHWCIFWGCMLAAAVTFPLSFGWIHFETAGAAQERTRPSSSACTSSRSSSPARSRRWSSTCSTSRRCWCIVGVSLAMWRRGRDRGALAVQQFGADLLPLVMLFAVSITGLFLTVSTHLMRGLHYGFLSQLHAVTVIFTLLYLPFGKFFHIFQRPAQLGCRVLQRGGRRGRPRRAVPRCGERVRLAHAHRRPRSRSSASSGSVRSSYAALTVARDGHALPGRLSALPAQESRADAGRALEVARRADGHGCPPRFPTLVARFGRIATARSRRAAGQRAANRTAS